MIRHAAVGALAGLSILGIGGRGAMVVASWLLDLPVNLTLTGALAVVVTGGIYGAVGGACYYVIRGRLPRLHLSRAVILGASLFLIIAVVSTANRQATVGWQYPIQTVLLFLPLAWAWALAVVRHTDPPNTGPISSQAQ